MRPYRLSADNFTELKRTPWAGDSISRNYKDELFPERVGERIGESWEFSCDPVLPSRVTSEDCTLPELVERNPNLLGKVAGKGTCEILIKLLNAREPLSLQVHPTDDDSNLKADECGKPESWLVLDAEPGCGLYLGFKEALSRDRLREILGDGDRAKDYLQFVPVKAGDYFEIEPGLAHAVGPGVTLLEPQRIIKGKSGKTYRMWDWGRKYNDQGQLDLECGQPRELHLEESLALVDAETQFGEAFVDQVRRVPKVQKISDGTTVRTFPANKNYEVSLVSLNGSSYEYGVGESYLAGVVLFGVVELNEERFQKGESFFVASSPQKLTISSKSSAELAFVLP